MNKYEVLYIVDASLTEEQRKAEIEKVTAFLNKSGAKDVTVEEWGNKKLAYAINFKKEGYYVLVNFEAEATVPNTLKHQLNLNEHILRNMIVAKEV